MSDHTRATQGGVRSILEPDSEITDGSENDPLVTDIPENQKNPSVSQRIWATSSEPLPLKKRKRILKQKRSKR